MSTGESSVTLLGSIIKQLSASSGDEKSRESEKKKIQQDLKNADEQLGTLVEENQEHLKKTIQSFGSVVTRVTACRSRIKVLHEKLVHCRTLLYCNRDDLKTHWQEGLECTEKLNLLDKIEKAVTVPEQLDKYISRKHFLHASRLLVETVKNLEGPLHAVDALRDLRASLNLRKAILHETIIDELNKQIYAEPQKSKKNVATDSNTAAFKRIFSTVKEPSRNELTIPVFKHTELYEDLQRDPGENVPLFMYLMVEALFELEKIPEAIESFKSRIKRDMMLVVRKVTDQVSKRAIEMTDVVAVEELVKKEYPEILVDLLDVAFDKFRVIALNHSILLVALDKAKERMNPIKTKDVSLYTKEDIWSKIQFAIKDMLEPYLGDQSIMNAQQTLASYGNSDGAIASFFTARKRLLGPNVTNQQKRTLFKFECSSSAEALHSYMREQDIASSLPEDTYADFIVWNTPQLLCKPQADNITAIFTPVMDFIKEIDRNTESTLGSEGVLHNFITEFVEKIFLTLTFHEVTEKASSVTKGHDALRNLCDSNAQKDLLLDRPLLKSTIVVFHIVQDLLTLMKKLPKYCNNFLEMINRILREYYDACYSSYKGVVVREADSSKVSKIISANWVRDDDIKRLLMTLPNWMHLHSDKVYEEEDEDMKSARDQQDKEASLLISNLEKQDIEKNQIIVDPFDIKALANLQESLEWLARHVKVFATNVSAKNTSVQITAGDETDNIIPAENLSNEHIRSLSLIADEFKDLAESILLVLHLEVRIHCFFFLGRAIKESSYVCNLDSIEVDIQIPQLSKDLKDIEEICSAALSYKKLRYIYHGIGYLMACIIIASTSYIKKINRNGVKKMCQNIFTIQQELTNITTRREWNLDLARQYFELLYAHPDEILGNINEQGARFKEQDYANALELLARSEIPFNEQMWKIRRNKLSEILKEKELEGKVIK
ncbi:exocyst complex component 4-like [Clytia hemisphaerica]|uniref:Exocyst complex component Sec8 n=1 Tax=Clytia hemisphaerica TaxID=252671 RepID=A0A7M5XIC3_9CNID